MSDWNTNSGTWQTAANWSSGIPNGAGAQAVFRETETDTATNVVSITALSSMMVGSMQIFSTATHSWDFQGGGGNAGLIFQTLFSEPAELLVSSQGSQVDFQPSLFIGVNSPLNVTTAGATTSLRIASVISGVGHITKYGAGTLELFNTNSFTGGLELRGGQTIAHIERSLGFGSVELAGASLLFDIGPAISTFSNSFVVTSGSGSSRIGAAASNSISLNGLNFTNLDSTQVFTIGGATETGAILLGFDSVYTRPGAGYALAGGIVLFADAYNAANFFHFGGSGQVDLLAGAQLNTRGFATVISNLNFDGGLLGTSAGAVDLFVEFSNPASVQQGTILGRTAGADRAIFSLLDGAVNKIIDLSQLTFDNWNNVTDTIGLLGSSLADQLTGSAQTDTIIAGAGDDVVHGGAERDLIYGEDGADQLFGDAGIDYIVAGAGNDLVFGGTEADEIYGQDGDDGLVGGAGFFTDILVGGDGNDTLNGDSGLGEFDWLYGNLGNDTFLVDTPADLVFEQPGEGIDTVFATINGAGFYLYDNIENLVLLGNTPFGVGNALDNVLTGSDQANWLLGGAGNDTLAGLGGNDVLFGEAGADIFYFGATAGQDLIGDFAHGTDKIRLVGTYTSFAEVSSHFVQNGANGAIDLGAGNFVVLQGVTMSTLNAGDFIFG